jgi:3-methyladenine DNA glycosylase AlkD
MQKFLTYDDVTHIKQYIKSKQWWDTIDGFDRIVENIAFTDSRINDLMLAWSTDEDFVEV